MEDLSSSKMFKRVYCFRNCNRNTECRKGIWKLRIVKESGTSKEKKKFLNANDIPSVLFPITRGPASHFRASGHPVAVTRFFVNRNKGDSQHELHVACAPNLGVFKHNCTK